MYRYRLARPTTALVLSTLLALGVTVGSFAPAAAQSGPTFDAVATSPNANDRQVTQKSHGPSISAAQNDLAMRATSLLGGNCEDPNSFYRPFYVHLPAEKHATGQQLQWNQSLGEFVPLALKLQYCNASGSNCSTISATLNTDGTVTIITPPNLLPAPPCGLNSNQLPFIVVKTVDNWTWSMDCGDFVGDSDGTCIIDTDWDVDILSTVSYFNGTKTLYRIGMAQHADAESAFTQHDLGDCGSGDYSMDLSRPTSWTSATQYCFRYWFE